MARNHTIAGYFKEVVSRQPITIKVTVHQKDESGNLLFEADGTKPLLKVEEKQEFVDVRDRIWVDQVDVPFTPEEEEARDAEEAIWENEKLKPVALTDREEMDLLLDQGPEAVKAKRAEHEKALQAWGMTHAPLMADALAKNNIVAESQRGKKNAESI